QQWLVCDADHAPFADQQFDALFAGEIIEHMPDVPATLAEWYRVLKPGARYACSEYLLTPFFDWDDEEHVALHRLFLPTLAATQSMYPADVCAALERAGFRILVSAPSKSEAWPLCEQKRDLILWGRRLVRALEKVRVAPPWIEESLDLLQRGGQAWTEAERAKLADLNWRIVAEKR
ncbi:class I SAM-dependent methyltransferase, partial [uncultured Nocardioides sp.]|uniref:class I SAM-dependent methyltransferase n=1 Tax=uncultured Nocardioides sp. TaxID=198441 RepID=UPI00260D87DD